MSSLFPNNCRGAVSLTYDDGLNVHLDHAIPDLNTAGLHGTFFIPTQQDPNGAWLTRPNDWQTAAARGHELANHTQHHPCQRKFDWVKKGFSAEDYDLPRMEKELKDCTAELQAIAGPSGGRTFAYPCGVDWVGESQTSYRHIADAMFVASRGGTKEIVPVDPAKFDRTRVPALAIVETMTLANILAYIDSAAERGHWAVLMFHGVGGGHPMNVTRENHQAIVSHVAKRRENMWCDTFLNVATCWRSGLS